MEIKTIDKVFYDALSDELNRIRKQKQKSFRNLSKRTGRSRQTLDNYFLGRTKIKESTFEELCRILDIEPKIQVSIKLG